MTTSEVCPKRCLSCKIREFWHLAAIRFSTRRFSARDVPIVFQKSAENTAVHRRSIYQLSDFSQVVVCVCVRVGVCFCVGCVCVCVQTLFQRDFSASFQAADYSSISKRLQLTKCGRARVLAPTDTAPVLPMGLWAHKPVPSISACDIVIGQRLNYDWHFELYIATTPSGNVLYR